MRTLQISSISAILTITRSSTSGFTYQPSCLSKQPQSFTSLPRSPFTVLYGKNRQSRRSEEQGRSRPNSFYDNIKDSEGKETKGKKPKKNKGGSNDEKVDIESAAKKAMEGDVKEEEDLVDNRPDLTTFTVDGETGIEKIEQGKYVMDVVTRRAVKLSDLGPQYRLAQMFPGVPPDVRQKHRVANFYSSKSFTGAQMVAKLEEACMYNGEMPPHPAVTNDSIDFMLANRDLLSVKMKKTLGRLKLKAQSLNQLDEARRYRKLLKKFLTLESHISAPFRQILVDAEEKLGPNFGNLDLKSYIGMEVYERTATYLILKGMAANWQQKTSDADYFENTQLPKESQASLLYVGDPKRYLPDPPIIFRYSEVIRIASMAQQTVATFVNDTALFDDLPVEVRFIESALKVKDGTTLRKFVVEDFCPSEEITPSALREGVRRLYAQLENVQLDPYGDLKNTLGKLCEAMESGTNEENDPYEPYILDIDSKAPGWFETYTFYHDGDSMIRFLDNAFDVDAENLGNTDDIISQLKGDVKTLFDFGPFDLRKKKEEKVFSTATEDDDYVPPPERSLGRPHMLGWLELLDGEDIADDTFEADKWEEIKNNS